MNTVKKTNKAGVTLVEILIAMFLVSVAAVIVYTEMLQSYRILARSRARLEAQNIAFDYLWGVYNLPQESLTNMATLSWMREATPASCIMYTNGIINCDIDVSNVSAKVLFWDISVQVWVPTNNPLQIGTNALAKYSVRRYRRDTE
jgi:prepilin-type N-terminal cleavage/methylation domain-containing protein